VSPRTYVVIAAAVFCSLLASTASAKSDPNAAAAAPAIDISELLASPKTHLWNGAQESIAAGDFTRVLVRFSAPSVKSDDLSGLDAIESTASRMSASREAMIGRVFGVSVDVLANARIDQPETRITETFEILPWVGMRVSAADIERLVADPLVEAVVASSPAYPTRLPQATNHVGAGALHDLGLTGAGATIAIIDTGVDHNHQAFAGRIVESICYSTTDPLGGRRSTCRNGDEDVTSANAGDHCLPLSENAAFGARGCDHGTKSASVAAGDFVNSGGTRFPGVAPGASIVAANASSVELYGSCGDAPPPCASFETEDIIKSLEYLLINRSRLNLSAISMSLGGGQVEDNNPF